jgi:PIN domain nuclease of toxin-antitoxin system
MRILLDTHTLVWAAFSVSKLSKRAASLIETRSNEIVVSAASAWEVATKVRLGKFDDAIEFERNFLEKIAEAGYTMLPISPAHALRAGRLPGNHGDPFDRIIAAQALAEDIPILSIDTKLESFGIHCIW